MVELWKRLLDALGPRVDRLKLRFGASRGDIDAAETALGFALPNDYRELLLIADGQDSGGLSIFPVCAWLSPIKQVVERFQREVSDPSIYPGACLLPDEPHLRCRLAARERLHIAHLRSQAMCGVRLAGSSPPELLAVFDDQHHIVLGPSLSMYLQRLVLGLESGDLGPCTYDYTGAQVIGLASGALWDPWTD